MLNLNFEDISIKLELLKTILISIVTFFTSLKITNIEFKEKITNKKYLLLFLFFSILFIVFCVMYIRYNISYSISFVSMIFLLSIMYSSFTSNKLGYAILLMSISLSINYIFWILGIAVSFIINIFYTLTNDYANFCIIIFVYILFVIRITKIKKVKNGLSFLYNKTNEDGYLDLILLNISVIILFSLIIFASTDGNSEYSRKLFVVLVFFDVIMFVTIKKSIQFHYIQNLKIKDLNETKKDLEIKTKEVQTLEQENLLYSKKAHSLEHKLKSLENKINKLTYNQEISKEIGIDKEIKDISKQMHNNIVYIELDKTGIEEIDDMLDTMRNEAIKNNIEFNLQLKGNIYQMTNNYIDKQDLAILLADHIKDAIIAINHTENINKSILVRLGKIDNCFALYIYDTGVEFKKEVLDNLGKIPITTYKEEGGTGMGFMNTFDTLNKTNASLTIKQIGPPSIDNYTKVIMITFDGKHEFKII